MDFDDSLATSTFVLVLKMLRYASFATTNDATTYNQTVSLLRTYILTLLVKLWLRANSYFIFVFPDIRSFTGG